MYVCMIFVNVNIMLFQLNGILLSPKKKSKGILHLFFSEKQWVTFIEKLRLRLNKQCFKILKGSFTICLNYIL